MSLYAIGDVHLSFVVNKPMNELFGPTWKHHAEKIRFHWMNSVKDSDTILIPGDISWASKLADAIPDLDFLHSLPGRKIIIKGNHDYWWNSTYKLNRRYDDITFIKNSSTSFEDYGICGTKGALCPNDSNFQPGDMKFYIREVNRMKKSLTRACNKGFVDNLIVLMHYPPTNDKKEDSDFLNLFRRFKVKKVIYAHLHGHDSFKASLQGKYDGVEYILVSSDYLNFRPLLIRT